MAGFSFVDVTATLTSSTGYVCFEAHFVRVCLGRFVMKLRKASVTCYVMHSYEVSLAEHLI